MKQLLFILVLFGLIGTLGAKPAQARWIRYHQAAVSWWGVADARSYNIYFRDPQSPTYSYAVPDLPSTSRRYTLRYLRPGVAYLYRVAAVKWDGKEYWVDSEKELLGIGPMSSWK